MEKIAANGWNFESKIEGEGPDLVFIHGEIHGIRYWEHQINEFKKDHRCLIYHRRGHSGTGAPFYGYSLENQRRDLEALMAHYQIERPVLIAVAFGTTIAADYAIHYPENVRGIVFVAWSELHEARLYLERWIKANEQVVKALEQKGRAGLVDLLRREGGRSLYMVIPPDEPLREACIQLFADHPLEEYRRGMLEFATSVPDLIEPLSTLEIPALGICGSEDPFPDQPEMLASMRNFIEAPYIQGAGRFVQWEQPALFNQIVRNFLARWP